MPHRRYFYEQIDHSDKLIGVIGLKKGREYNLYTYLDRLNKTGIFRAIQKYSSKQTRKPAKIFLEIQIYCML